MRRLVVCVFSAILSLVLAFSIQINLAFVGDLMFHSTLLRAAKRGERYDFTPFFAHVRDIISSADLAFCNLETTLAGPPYTGYPLFSTPDAALDALKWAGFDVINVANNHMLDRGIEGLLRTVRKIREAGLCAVGARLEKTEPRYTVVNVKGLKVAFCSFTYGTNGLRAPAAYSYVFDYIDRQVVSETVSQMRAVADIVVVHFHFGVEHALKPTEEQKRLSKMCIDLGADLVIGTHPHVLQKVSIVQHGGKRKMIAYSLGNFVGDMESNLTKLGVILNVTFDVRVGVVGVQPVLVWTQKFWPSGQLSFRVVPVEAFLKNGDSHFPGSEAELVSQIVARVGFSVQEE